VDWHDWHRPYEDPDSPLSRRLRLVQDHIARWLDQRTEPSLTVVSACAGQGHDLLGVLAARPDANRVRATLIEYDPRNVAAARAAAPPQVEVRRADAGDRSAYRDTGRADLLLLAGVFGNVSEDDVRATIAALPELCAPDATVIWTRTRRPPDLTPAVRAWFAAAGFAEEAFHAPADVLFSVGVHRFTGTPRPLGAGRMFAFAPAPPGS
jgi:hypothetical protein